MHSVFRVGEMKQMEKDNRLWQVELTLTSDSDPQLHRLTESIHEETFSSSRGWFRLGQLLTKLAQFDKAEELYEILLRQSTDEGEKGHLYHMFGTIKSEQGKNKEAVGYYEKSITIKQKMLPPTHEIIRKHFKSDKRLFLQIILIWLLLTTISALCIRKSVITQRHSHIWNVLWTFFNVHFLLITLTSKLWKRVLK